MYGPKIFTFSTFLTFFFRERVPIPRQKMAAGARVIRDSVISVIPAGVGATVERSYCECVAPWVMHKKLGEVNGKHVCKDENQMR
jgi:hypothetical protein